MLLSDIIAFLNENAWGILIALGIAFIVYRLGVMLSRCFLEAGDFHAYAIHDGTGIVDIVKQPKFHFSLKNRIVRGSARAREFQISYYDTQLKEIIPYPLLNPNTGAISLRDVSLCLTELTEFSHDNQPMKFRAELRFRLDVHNLKKCFLSTRFGDSLERYFEFTIRQLISSMNDEEILVKGAEMRAMAEKEMADFGSKRGFIVNRVLLNVVRGPLELVSTGGEEGGEQHIIPIIDPTSLQYLDRLRDTFANSGQHNSQIDRTRLLEQANQHILELMRLRSMQCIAHELAQSKSGLIVISADEVGLAKTAVSRGKIASAITDK